ncbi:XTP/dITP diphosphatase [bacterium]|nr:XTP/dITP diphosphatase [bacterium]
MELTKLLLATNNKDKIKELQAILDNSNISLVSLGDISNIDIEETGSTLEENALIKAHAAFKETGLPSIADDTGLEVDFLDGAPGVYSARFAGENATYADNNKKLIELLNGVSSEKRSARFRCVAAFVYKDVEFSVEGVCEGLILDKITGSRGFGYDPVFFVKEEGKTFAEMTKEEKNRISHRGKAFRKAAEEIRKIFLMP